MANRELMVEALKSHAKGHIDKHRANVLNLMENPAGVAEHPDHLEKELKIIAEYQDQIDIINKYFKANP